MADEELEALRKKRLMELQAQQQLNQELAEQQETQAAQEYEDARKKIMRAILTPEARERLTKIRMIKPEFADSIEKQLIALAQSGRIQNQIDDATLKQILDKITPKKREPTIRRG